MDEEHYKIIKTHLVQLPCVFEKAILASRVECSQSARKNIAEREVVLCSAANCQQRCENWLQQLRQKARFSLGLSTQGNHTAILPHSKEMKIQVGGLYGLKQLLFGADGKNDLLDVAKLLERGAQEYAGFEMLPYAEIMPAISQFKLR